MRDSQWKKLETGSTSSGGSKEKQHPVSPQGAYLSRLPRILPYCVVVALAILLLVGLFNVWNRMALVQLGYEISTLETKNKELQGRVRELSLELSSLESPVEIEKKATKQGLKMPSVGRIIHVP
jgi:cell division protein FtsL